MQVTLITIGTLKEDYWRKAFEEYAKRISTYATFKELNIQECKIQNEDDESCIKKALDEEGKKVLSLIPQDSYKVALCVEGKQLTSEEFASTIKSAENESGKISFVIGSSYGLSDEVKKKMDLKLSISKFTFPHQLIRVMFLESIYRAFTIIHNKKYHK